MGWADAKGARRLRRARPRVGAAIVASAFLLALVAEGCGLSRPPPVASTEEPIEVTAQPTVAGVRWRRDRAQATAAPNGQVARIGAALSLTGRAKMFGAAQRSGITLAQDEINSSPLMGGTRLEIIIDDDASDREQAAVVFGRFIERNHVVAIMGPTQSDTAFSVDPIAQQAGVPVLAISNAATGITQIGNFIFRDVLTESQLTPQVVKTVRNRLKVRNAALLYADKDVNRSGARGFKSGLQAQGVRISTEQVYAEGQTDFTSQLDEISMSRPDALFVTVPAYAAAQLLIQARQDRRIAVPIIGSNAFNSDTVVRSAGDAAEGLIVGSSWSAANPSPRNMAFIESYRARYGVDPDQLAAQAYTGVYILATAIKDAGTTTDSRAVRDALERVKNLDTPLGAFSFNEAHDAAYPAVVQIVSKGRFEIF